MIKTDLNNRWLRMIAIACLLLLAIDILAQMMYVWQARYELVSPIIPASIIEEMSKQFIFKAAVAAVVLAVVLVLYFFKKYVPVIVLVIATLIASRYIYI